MSLPAVAATITWDGGSNGTNHWTSGNNGNASGRQNWVLKADPVAGDFLEFAGVTRLAPNNTTNASTNYIGITFISGAGAFVLGGNAITLGGNVTNSSINLQSINMNLILSGSRSFGAASANLAVGGVMSESSAGTGALIKTGGNALTLTNQNTFTGGTSINAGTLALGNATNTLANTGAVTVNGATAVLSIAANSDTVGAVSLRNGAQITGSTGILTGSSYAFESGSVSAILGGSGALTKSTSGTVALTAANLHSGLTTISGGTLLANNTTGSSTGAGAVSVGSGGTLGGTGTIAPTVANGINVTGVLAPGGSVGTGNLTLNLTNTTGTVVMASSTAGLVFQLGLAGTDITLFGTSDLLTIAGASAGDFTFSNNTINFLGTGNIGFYKIFDTSSNLANTWTGLTVNSGLITGGLNVSNLSTGLSGNLIMGGSTFGGTPGDIYLQVVPEPSAALLGGLGLLCLLRRRKA